MVLVRRIGQVLTPRFSPTMCMFIGRGVSGGEEQVEEHQLLALVVMKLPEQT